MRERVALARRKATRAARRALRGALLAAGVHRRGFAQAREAFPERFGKPILRFDPREVGSLIDTKHWPRSQHRAFLLDGDWDRVRVERPIIARTIEQVFAEGVPYTESEQFAHMVAVLESGSGEWNYRCESLEDIHAYFASLEAAFVSIRDEGYRTQAELGGDRWDEIQAYLDRRGTLVIGNEGNHRYEMARVLGLTSVPMQLRGVHTAWARSCYDRFGPPLERAVRAGLEERTVD